jgi:hypothetical protein
MNKKHRSYLLLGVLGIFVLLLNTVPTLADSNGNLRIESSPTGANVYVLYGANAGKYVGTTPFVLAQGVYQSGTWFKMVEPGYKQGNFPIYSYMYQQPYIRGYLNPIN